MENKKRYIKPKPQTDSEILKVLETGKLQHLARGSRIQNETDHCCNFIWLVKGTVRVFKNSAHGREITLYRVNSGETCILNLRRLLLGKTYSVETVTETDITFLTLTHAQ
jgi:CRP/FNR family transcriptional regulator, anaerobic regulatory protein